MNPAIVTLTFLIHVMSTWFMIGVIWFVQIVHYPLFAKINQSDFIEFEKLHMRLTTWVVLPAMLLELVTSILLFWLHPRGILMSQMVMGIVFVTIIWLSTFFVQVPCHEQLSKSFDDTIHQRLVQSNWLRTICWSLRGALSCWMIWNTYHYHASAEVSAIL